LPPKRLRNGFYDTVDGDDHFETKSHFTNYSMTSSILSRTKELQFLDERFDKVMEGYDDEEIGELEDGPEYLFFSLLVVDLRAQSFSFFLLTRVHGVRTLENFESVLDEFLEEHAEITYKGALDQSAEMTKEAMKAQILNSLDALEHSTGTSQQVPQRAKPAWDCESFLSTYSNLENHPGVIREKSKKQIVLDKSGMPKGFVNPGSKKAVAAAATAAAADGEGENVSSNGVPSDKAAGSVVLRPHAEGEDKNNDDTESEGSEPESGKRDQFLDLNC